MYVVTVEFVIKQQFAAAFRQRVQQQALDSLQRESDCHVFDVCVDPECDNVVFLYEVYADAAAFDAHLAAPHFLDFDATVGPWVENKRVTRYLRLERDEA